MQKFSKMDPLSVWYAKTTAADFIESLPAALQRNVKKRIEKGATRGSSELDFPKLAGTIGGRARIIDQPPLIFHSETTRAPAAEEKLEQLFHAYEKSISEDRRILLDQYRLTDAAIKDW